MTKNGIKVLIAVFVLIAAGWAIVYFSPGDEAGDNIFAGVKDAKEYLLKFPVDEATPDAMIPMDPDFDQAGNKEAAVYGVDPGGGSILDGLKTISLKYLAYHTERDEFGDVLWLRLRHLDSGTPDIRYELSSGYVSILNYRQREIWTKQMGVYVREPLLQEQSFNDLYFQDLNAVLKRLYEIEFWTGEGNVVVSYGGRVKAIIYDIELNPALSDELFMP
jgi:hypothetical protein